MSYQVAKLIARIAENLPEIPEDIMQCWIENPKGLQAFLAGLCSPSNSFRLVPIIDRDMTGWKCVDPVDAEKGKFEPVLQEFMQKRDGGRLGGERMVERVKEQKIQSGLCHAEAMLRNQERIPVEWRKYCLVFPEVWQGPGGYRYMFFLSWYGSRWYLDYCSLGDVFDSSYRLVASRK